LLDNFKKLFTNVTTVSDKISNKQTVYTLSTDIHNIGYDTYDTISKAIEATKGKEYFIHETTDNNTICKGCWVEYILQKES